MKITEQALFDNGYQDAEMSLVFPVLRKSIRESDGYERAVDIVVSFRPTRTEVILDWKFTLPNITTMEHLAQLEYFLSPYVVMDTAPIDTAIRARFAEGGGSDL